VKHFVNLIGKPISVGGEDGLSISPSKKVAKVVVKDRVVDRVPLPNGKTIEIVQPIGRITGLPRYDEKTIKIVTPAVYAALKTERKDIVTAPGIEKGKVQKFYQHQPLEMLQLKAAATQIRNLKAQLQQRKRKKLNRRRVRKTAFSLVESFIILALGAFPSGEGSGNNKAAEIRPPAVRRTVKYQKPTVQTLEQVTRQTRVLPYTYSGNIQVAKEGTKKKKGKEKEKNFLQKLQERGKKLFAKNYIAEMPL